MYLGSAQSGPFTYMSYRKIKAMWQPHSANGRNRINLA